MDVPRQLRAGQLLAPRFRTADSAAGARAASSLSCTQVGGCSQRGQPRLPPPPGPTPHAARHPCKRTGLAGGAGQRRPRPTSPRREGGEGRRKGVFPPRAPRKGPPGLTPAPGVRGGLRGGLPSRNLVAGAQGRRPDPARPGCRKRGRVGRDLPHGRVGTQKGTEGKTGGSEPSRGGPRAPATYQQALHVDGRARVSDQRLQLPLAARARPVPRHVLGGAGHFPRRRGPAHAAAGPALPLPALRPGRLGA